MNDHREGNPCPFCYFHPEEVIVGICALCLKERLIALASRQGQLQLPKDSRGPFKLLRRKPSLTLPIPKVFALHRHDSRRHAPVVVDSSGESSVASLEGSFISIKFEDDGKASWESKNKAGMVTEPKSPMKENRGGKSIVEQTKAWGPPRWRKRIGHLLQVARWKRSSKAGACHVGLVAKVEARRGNWIRSLTRRRRTTTTTTTTLD